MGPSYIRSQTKGSSPLSVVLHEQAPVRRVRQEVRDALAVACFTAGASVAVALTLVLMVSLVGQQA